MESSLCDYPCILFRFRSGVKEMPLHLTNCGPTVTEPDILAFERRVGVSLPESYRRFLLEINGGDGPVDESEFSPDRFNSLHWLGGPVTEQDSAASFADSMGWSDPDFHRDLELAVRGFWKSGLARTWLPIGGTNHEDLLLLRLEDGSIWQMSLRRGWFDEDACTKVANTFDELGVRRA